MNALNRKNTTPIAACAAACALAALGRPAFGQFTFAAPVNVPVGSQPSGAAFADFDGDGDVDLATLTENPDRVRILSNDGSGGFTLGPASALPSSSSPQDLIAGDFDGDGDADLAVAVRDPVGSVIIMANGGTGLFSNIGTYPVGDRPRGLSAADLEGDGDIDLAVANRDSNSASVLTNNGAATFTVATLDVGGETRGTALGNFTGDGRLDLAVTDHDGRTVVIFANANSLPPTMILSIGPVVRPDGMTSADLDNDGDVDLAIAASDATLGISRAVVFVNTGAGFAPAVQFNTAGLNSSAIRAGDLDCDGLADLATANDDSNNVSLLANVGAAAFGPAMLIATGTRPESIVIADFDGNGNPDLASANRDSGDVSIAINQTCVPCPSDVDGNGQVGITDLLDLLAAWGPNPGSPADLNGDGTVGINDLLTLLADWGPCP